MAIISRTARLTIRAVSILACLLSAVCGSNFHRHFEVTWGGDRARIFDSGEVLTLSLDRVSGSGFQSKNMFMFGRVDMQLKLVTGNSAGTVTSYYLKSEGSAWDEIDFEFLGNVTGEPYVVHTNVYTQGKGDREQQFYLWFDPTKDFHSYSILWNPQNVIFYVDNVPIREFKNMELKGVAFPKRQPMRLFSSIYNADQWATRGGLVKTDWSMAPFTASYRGFSVDSACIWLPSMKSSSCLASAPWLRAQLDQKGAKRMKRVQKSFRIYDYCVDGKRFPGGLPPECMAQ